jgi:hypothetical protein
MKPTLLVVARGTSTLNKFEQGSLLEAFNIRDFLEETGDYIEVCIFQLLSSKGPTKEWVKLNDPDR